MRTVALLVALVLSNAGVMRATDSEAEDPRPASSELGDRDKKLALESFVKPYHAGHWDSVIQNVRKSLTRRELDDVQAISEYLRNSGEPTLAEMVTRCRIYLTRAGSSDLPAPTTLESFLMTRQLASMVEDVIEELGKTKIMADPLEDPKDFSVYRDLVWEWHVYSNERHNALRLVKQGLELRRQADRSRSTRYDEGAREGLKEYSFSAYEKTLRDLQDEMDERALEVRVHRVKYAVAVLDDPAAGTKDRFFAAYVIGVDSESLLKEIKARQPRLNRPLFQQADLLDELGEELSRGKQLAGDLMEKSRLLFAGLHWWRRGRYGAGTEAFGLLKSRAAIRDPNLRFALLMPKTTPIPTDPLIPSKQPVPNYQRRHLFVWAYEDRAFSQTSRTSSQVRYQNTQSPLKDRHFDGMIGDRFW